MALAQQGDKKSYAAFLEEAARMIRSYIRRKINTKEDVEDVTQEVLLSIHRARKTYDPKRPVKPWILAIATYRINDYLRKHYRISGREVFGHDALNTISSDSDVTSTSDKSESLIKALDSLPEKQRKIITMMKIEGHSVKDIAKHFGMSVSAVKVSAHRSYKKLKNIMK